MQKIIFPLALLMIGLTMSFSACSQETAIDKFYNKHHGSGEGAGDLFKSSFSVNASFSGEDQKKWKNKVSLFRMLILDAKNDPSLGHDIDNLSQALRNDQFDDLFTVRKGKENVRLLSKDEKGSIKEVVFLATGKDGGCVFVNIKGKFSTQDMNDIQASFTDNDNKGIVLN